MMANQWDLDRRMLGWWDSGEEEEGAAGVRGERRMCNKWKSEEYLELGLSWAIK